MRGLSVHSSLSPFFPAEATELEKFSTPGGVPTTNVGLHFSVKSVMTALTAVVNDGMVNSIQFLKPIVIKDMWSTLNPRVNDNTYMGALGKNGQSVFASSCIRPGLHFNPSNPPYMLGGYQSSTPLKGDICAWGGWVGTKFALYPDSKVALFSFGTRRNELGGQVPNAHDPISALMGEAAKELDVENVWECDSTTSPTGFASHLYN